MKSIAFTTIAALIALAGTARAAEPRGSLDELRAYCFPDNKARSAELQWMPGDEAFARVADDGLSVGLFNPATGAATATLLDLNDTRGHSAKGPIDEFIVSPDGRKVLIATDKKPVYRRSWTAHWWVYDCHSRSLAPLSDQCPRQMIPVFSPDSRMVAFADTTGNLRLRKLDYNTEVAVTTDGIARQITNGVPDWTYEEEFFTTASLAWAPDCLTLCWLRYDQRATPPYTMPVYESCTEPDPALAARPGTFTYRYPLAGDPNSTVTLHSYNIETRQSRQIDLSATGCEYIPAIAYAGSSSETLMAVTLNRDQNRLEIVAVNPRSTSWKSVWTDAPADGWIDPLAYTAFKCADNFFVTATERSGWLQLVEVSYSGVANRAVTPDGQDATAYYGYDAARSRHWWQATGGDPLCRVVGSTDAKGNFKVNSPTGATAWAGSFSPAMTYAVAGYSAPDTPPVYTLVKTDAYAKTVRTLEDNAALRSRFASMPQKTFFTMPADSQGPELNGFYLTDGKPGAKPVIMYQYSGPGSQEVRRSWNVDWMQYYASQGYMVVCVDGRGTGGRGAAFRHAVYKQLGHYETIDQLRAAAYAATLPGADPSRIGIFGWSYGGYETLMAATAPQAPYKAAVAVAPVSDWRFYDSVYTERFMLTPGQNPDGYNRASALARASALECPLLVMYGTADDNVHPCNSLDYVGALIAAGKWADMLVFPGMNHSINGGQTRSMVYWRMLQFFNSKL